MMFRVRSLHGHEAHTMPPVSPGHLLGGTDAAHDEVQAIDCGIRVATVSFLCGTEGQDGVGKRAVGTFYKGEVVDAQRGRRAIGLREGGRDKRVRGIAEGVPELVVVADAPVRVFRAD